MGTIIDNATVTHASWRSRHSALRIAVATAKDCLHEAGCAANDLDLLVNAGIYRDRNLGEPALAALIQEDVGAHPEDPHPDTHGTFSFDIANGTCGPLTALQVADGFLRSSTIQRALVVASDADPGHGLSEHFPFSGAGGALLCGWAADDSGFDSFSWANFPDGGESFHSTVSYRDGRNRLEIVASDQMDKAYAAAGSKVALAAWTAPRPTWLRSTSSLLHRRDPASERIWQPTSISPSSGSPSRVMNESTQLHSSQRSTTRA